MRRLFAGLALVSSLALSAPLMADDRPIFMASEVAMDALPIGEYIIDLSHTSVTFKVDHLGVSKYTARFKRVEGKLNLDPAAPGKANVEAVIDATSLETDYPTPAEHDFNAKLTGEGWLDAKTHPTITFKSTGIELTGAKTANVTGDLTMRGVTKPVTLAVTFNGGIPSIPMDSNKARIGFSATGTLKRSDFGVSYGIPPAGSSMGVGDEVQVIIETEFTAPGKTAAPVEPTK